MNKLATENKAILITGASSGIGKATAVYLARHGFTVFATVRRDDQAAELARMGIPTLTPVAPVDLTQSEQIKAAANRITSELEQRGINGLYGLINNAGGGGVAPIELMDIDVFRTEFETRLLGPVAFLQALLPLIRQAHGRILWTVTPALIPIKYVTSIHAADFAVNCLVRTLNLELKPWNIPNIMIRCGGIRTSAVQRTEQEMEANFRRWPKERLDLYHDALLEEQRTLSDFDQKRSEPEAVAKVMYQALTAMKPKTRYSVGYLSKLAGSMELVPQAAADMIMEMRG
jgi:NAD(P)-dependent dehydrogenase (short-subunit alcohol dehydrogenase family)